MRFLQAILKFLAAIFGRRGGGSAQPTTGDHCSLIDIDIPADYDIDAIPEVNSTVEAAELIFAASAMAVSAQDAIPDASASTFNCTATVKANLGRVNVRSGPRTEFTPLVQTRGGVSFPLVGASEPDPDGFRWYSVKVGGETGWIRGDLVELSIDCAQFTFISEDEVGPDAKPPIISNKFPLPVDGAITTPYTRSHRGLDLAAPMGTQLLAAADGLCIRRIDCEACTEDRPNVQPRPGVGCPELFKRKDWGFGYGNFLVIRHNYEVLPPALRAEMDKQNLTGGFAYVLYAHMSRLDVNIGDPVQQGQLIGLTGNHGCSSGPHLHFEVRIGKDETVDGRWLNQTPVNPNLMFVVD